MQTSDYQGEKFRHFVEKLGLSIAEVARKLDITRDTVYAWFSKEVLKPKNVEKIINAFNVSEEVIWGKSLTSERLNDSLNRYSALRAIESLQERPEFKEEPFLKEMAEKILREDPYYGLEGVNVKIKSKEEITPIPYDDYMMVEYVDLSASAGVLGGSDVDILPDYKKRLVPKEFENGNYIVVRVNGDSMTDGTDISIPDGVEILVKEHFLEPGDKLPIRGNLFVICSREGNVFKQIVEHNTELGYIRCHSYNPKYEDYNIPMSEVFQIFVYRKIVGHRPNIPEIR